MKSILRPRTFCLNVWLWALPLRSGIANETKCQPSRQHSCRIKGQRGSFEKYHERHMIISKDLLRAFVMTR